MSVFNKFNSLGTIIEYYRLLQHVRETNSWEEWILYMVEDVEQTAIETIGLIRKEKLGTGNYYINEQLFELVSRR